MERVSELALAIADLAAVLECTPIQKGRGLWRCQVDENWTVKVNANDEDVEHVPPFHFSVEWCGFPAGIFSSFGDGFIAAGELANEDTLLDALKAATGRNCEGVTWQYTEGKVV